jgi:hypothetical protein
MRVLRSKSILTATAVALLAGGVLASTVGAAGKRRAVSVVVSGLNNPRGLAFAHGHLYVAEAGTAGTDCPKGAKGPTGGQLCVGLTSALAVISHGAAHSVVSGLISNSDTGPVATEGLEAVAGTRTGLLVAFGESTSGAIAALPPGATVTPADAAAAGAELGRLDSVAGRHLKVLADVGDADYAWSKKHKNLVPAQFPDANPNALVQVGSTVYVIDAASNTLDSVDARGHVRQLAFFPNPPARDAVPTCVAAGPGGNLYVGQLAPGARHNGGVIFAYNIAKHHFSVWKRGFNVVDGCGFDNAGNFYAVELQAHGFNPSPTGNPAGDVIEITKNGKRTVLGAGKLFFPQGFASDGRGNIYVSNWSIMHGTPTRPGGPTGEIVRISP